KNAMHASVPLVPTFVRARAARGYERRDRDTRARARALLKPESPGREGPPPAETVEQPRSAETIGQPAWLGSSDRAIELAPRLLHNRMALSPFDSSGNKGPRDAHGMDHRRGRRRPRAVRGHHLQPAGPAA